MSRRHRLAVVVLVPAPVDREIDGLRRALGDRQLTVVAPHCTLVPPVNVAPAELDAALAVLRHAAARCPPLTLELGPPTSFRPVTPTLHLAVGPLEAVDALGRVRDALFQAPLARRVDHEFIPHVTLSIDHPPGRIDAALDALGGYSAAVEIDRLWMLEEQVVAGGGRRWEPLADAPLAPPAVVGRGGLPLELTTTVHADPEVRRFLAALEPVGSAEPAEPAARPPSARPLVVTGRRDGAVVGVAEGWTRDEEGQLLAVVVAPDARRQGIGSHLVAAFQSAAHDRGADRLGATRARGAADAAVVAALLEGRGWTLS